MSKENGQLQLANYWQQKMSEYMGGGVVPMSAKEYRQVKNLILHTAQLSRRIIDFAFKHWSLIQTAAMLQSGIESSPSRPHIGYLLTHRKIAISLMVMHNILSQEEVDEQLEVAPHIDLQFMG